jgi:TPR repeat protein
MVKIPAVALVICMVLSGCKSASIKHSSSPSSPPSDKNPTELYQDAKTAYDRGEYKSAIADLLIAAGQGDAKSQCLLGTMYGGGKGVPKNEAEAVNWYRKAAEQGLAEAQFSLGAAYHEGSGVTQDYDEANKWTRKAAEQGYTQAQYNLGVMYYNDRCMPRNYVLAHTWLNLAAANGMKKAGKFRDKVEKLMTKEQIAEAQRLAREWKPKKERYYPERGSDLPPGNRSR